MLGERDIDSVCMLMKDLQPNIGGSRDPSMYQALCREALSDKRVVFIVGEEQTKVIAFYIAVIDRNKWRLSFLSRHPLIVLKMVLKRTFNRLSKISKGVSGEQADVETKMPDISAYISPSTTNRSWKDSSPQIAKLLFYGVAVTHRGKHVAKRLIEHMLRTLFERGVSRADAIILLHNIAEVRVVHGLGFNIYRQGGCLFVTKDLS